MKVRIPAWLLTVAYFLALASITTEWPTRLRAQTGVKPGPSDRRESSGPALSERSESKRPSTTRTLRLPEVPYKYADVDLPAHFKRDAAQRFDNTPPDNAVTDQGATLGRVLFYDTRLSANNTIAC